MPRGWVNRFRDGEHIMHRSQEMATILNQGAVESFHAAKSYEGCPKV